MSTGTTKTELACLYTRHKTQKRKRWNDGRLLVHPQSCRVSLFDANPPPGSGKAELDGVELSKDQIQSVIALVETELEMERYLIQLEGVWCGNNNKQNINGGNKSSLLSIGGGDGKVSISKGMKKVLGTKFRRPKVYRPPHPEEKKRRETAMQQKKRAPLQPGELERRYHGNNHSNSNSGNSQYGPPQQSHPFNQQQHPQHNHQQVTPQHRHQESQQRSDNGWNNNHSGDRIRQDEMRPLQRQYSTAHAHPPTQRQANQLPSQSNNVARPNDNLQHRSNSSSYSNAHPPVGNSNGPRDALCQDSADFDPHSFYGEEEEDSTDGNDEEESDSENIAGIIKPLYSDQDGNKDRRCEVSNQKNVLPIQQQQKKQKHNNQYFENNANHGFFQEATAQSTNDNNANCDDVVPQSTTFEPPATKNNNNHHEEGGDDVLSKSDLLQLFGGTPTPPPSNNDDHDDKKDIQDSNQSAFQASCALTTTKKRQRNGQQQCNVPNNDKNDFFKNLLQAESKIDQQQNTLLPQDSCNDNNTGGAFSWNDDSTNHNDYDYHDDDDHEDDDGLNNDENDKHLHADNHPVGGDDVPNDPASHGNNKDNSALIPSNKQETPDAFDFNLPSASDSSESEDEHEE